ncbi:MAG: RlpA-like double-psi beta-barrel domain-containing protein [Solirubrobacteraceae bacterium]
MRPQTLRRAAPAGGLVGALGSVIALSAPAPALAQSDTAGTPIQIAVRDGSLRYGAAVDVRGRLASGQPGVPVALQYQPAGAAVWLELRATATRAGGAFRLRAPLRRSGAVRVVDATPHAFAAQDVVPAPTASSEHAVRVAAALRTDHVRRNLTAGRTVRVQGELRPGGAGRSVALQLRRAGRWRTVDRDRTSAGGAYRLSERLRSPGSSRARLRFAGDGANAPTKRGIGRVNAYRRAFASAYGPGLFGNPLACGGTFTAATVGVAHKTLPCGTRLMLRYHGRTVRARVVDRGPFVAGREFDLTWATKNRLHHPGMGVIQVAHR